MTLDPEMRVRLLAALLAVSVCVPATSASARPLAPSPEPAGFVGDTLEGFGDADQLRVSL
jgi:hypothetical protein